MGSPRPQTVIQRYDNIGRTHLVSGCHAVALRASINRRAFRGDVQSGAVSKRMASKSNQPISASTVFSTCPAASEHSHIVATRQPFGQQLSFYASVASDVAFELRAPEVGPGRWRGCEPAVFMAVPEASMNENCDFLAWKHNVRTPCKILAMQSKADANSMQRATKSDFRPGVSMANGGHHP
jgi:hypothetical protein